MLFRRTLTSMSLVCLALLSIPRPLDAETQDHVTTKKGSILRGRIIAMTKGELVMETEWSKEVKVKWTEVTGLETSRAVSLLLKDGTILNGVVERAAPGQVRIQSESLGYPKVIKLAEVEAVTSLTKPPVTFKGALGLGLNISSGNTNVRTFSSTWELEARSKRQRLTLNGYSNYGDDGDDVIVRNSRGALKYDFFVTKRLYPYAASFLEADAFQDLRLRTALSGGLGYQLIRKTDFEAPMLKALELSVEAGVAYFDEDFRRAEDNAHVAGRWALKLDWTIIPKRLALFHAQEGYPSFEKSEDIYILFQQGVRLTIVKNFAATFSVNFRWDGSPAAGNSHSDVLYLATLDYTFRF